VIKHNIAKFIGDYRIVVIFCEFGTLAKDILQKALELYKSKHIKNQSFFFLALCVFIKKMFQDGQIFERILRKLLI